MAPDAESAGRERRPRLSTARRTLDPVRAAWLGLSLAALLVAAFLPLVDARRRVRV